MAENTQHYHSKQVAISIPLEKIGTFPFFLEITISLSHVALCPKLQIYLDYSSTSLLKIVLCIPSGSMKTKINHTLQSSATEHHVPPFSLSLKLMKRKFVELPPTKQQQKWSPAGPVTSSPGSTSTPPASIFWWRDADSYNLHKEPKSHNIPSLVFAHHLVTITELTSHRK